MSIDLTNYREIATAMFCRIDVPGSTVLRFSNYGSTQIINGESYQPLGQLLAVADSDSSIRAVQGNMSITISGIPNSSITQVLAQKFKGSNVQVWRVFFDAATGTQLNITGNPAGRFQGIVNNWLLEEDYTAGSDLTNRIVFACSSTIDVLFNKVSGRRTNDTDQKSLYPGDTSFDRVVALRNSNFNFGTPY